MGYLGLGLGLGLGWVRVRVRVRFRVLFLSCRAYLLDIATLTVLADNLLTYSFVLLRMLT